MKGLNNWLENRVKTLEEELENSKIDLENLELLYNNSSCLCDSKAFENCETLENKVHYLIKTVYKLSKGKSNFETVLPSQKCVFEKSGWGLIHKTRKVGFQSLFQKCQKNNRLKNRNNLLLHVFIA